MLVDYLIGTSYPRPQYNHHLQPQPAVPMPRVRLRAPSPLVPLATPLRDSHLETKLPVRSSPPVFCHLTIRLCVRLRVVCCFVPYSPSLVRAALLDWRLSQIAANDTRHSDVAQDTQPRTETSYSPFSILNFPPPLVRAASQFPLHHAVAPLQSRAQTASCRPHRRALGPV